MESTTYEQFPKGIVIGIILFSFLLYALGAYILSRFGLIFVILYLLYCFFIEINVIWRSCRSCYYYGKICGFGKGWICSKVFTKTNREAFTKKNISFLTLIPDFMVLIFPIIGGILCLVTGFSLFCLGVLIVFIVLYLAGTGAIRGSFACKYCKQRELGCPAEQLFSKKT